MHAADDSFPGADAESASEIGMLAPDRGGLDETRRQQRRQAVIQGSRFVTAATRRQHVGELELGVDRRVRLLARAVRQDIHRAPKFRFGLAELAAVALDQAAQACDRAEPRMRRGIQCREGRGGELTEGLTG